MTLVATGKQTLSFLDQLDATLSRSRVLPAGRFFEPLPRFWDFIRGVYATNARLVDAGAGEGHVMAEACDVHDLAMLALDKCDREGQDPRVVRLDARTFDWKPNIWPLMCRPDHSGWCRDVVLRARAAGATSIYVGKPGNYKTDIHGLGARKLPRVAGRGGEYIYVIPPRNLNKI